MKLITVAEEDFNYLKMEAGKLVAEVRSLVKKIENHDPTSGIALAPHSAPAAAQADTVETQVSNITTVGPAFESTPAPAEPTPEPAPEAPAETAPEAPTPAPEPEAPAAS
jgi:hypothetical protein